MSQEGAEASPAYYSCLISYNHEDEVIATRLYNDLIQHGVQCWKYTEDVQIGDKIEAEIEQAIQTSDKVMVILSAHSVQSNWVADEVEEALAREEREKSKILFPITIADAIRKAKFGWASKVKRHRHIGDFTQWQDDGAYQKAVQRLMRDFGTFTQPPLIPSRRTEQQVGIKRTDAMSYPAEISSKRRSPLERQRIVIGIIMVLLLFASIGVLYVTHSTISSQRSSQGTTSDWPYSSSSATVTDSLAQDRGNWVTHTGDYTCNYENGSYISSYQDQGNSMCDSNYSWRQVAFMIDYTQRSGTPPAGILMSIGLNSKTGECYLIYIGGNGTYILRYRPSITSPDKILQEGQTATLYRSDKTNTMGVISHHNTLSLYVNNQFITLILNTPSLSGLISIGASAVDNSRTTIAFNNMKIWALT